MADDIGFFDWAFKGLVTVLFTVGGWLWLMLIGKVKDQDKVIDETKDEIADHKLWSAQNYTTKVDSNRQYDELSKKLDKITDILTVGRPHP